MPAYVPKIGRSGLLGAVLALLALVLVGVRPAAAPAAAPGAFTAPDDPAVPALIKSLQSCLTGLTAADRQVLTLRAGLGGQAAQLTAEIAATVGGTAAATSAIEVTAIRRLEAARRRGVCQAQAAATKPAPAKAKTPTKPATAPATTAGSGGSSVSGLEVLALVLLVLAFFAGITFEILRSRPPA